jgi:hypothetical protein
MQPILAIDPGNVLSAFVVWDGVRQTALSEQPGELLNFGKVPNQELLRMIQDTFRSHTGVCVIEMIGHYGTGMSPGKTVYDTCVFIGRFGERYGWDRVRVVLRPTVKAHICGSARAKDGNVIQALKDRFGDRGTKASKGFFYGVSADVWQATALAVCFWDQHLRDNVEDF